MKKALKIVAVLVMFFWAGDASAKDRVGKIRVGLFHTEPLNFLDDHGRVSGFNPDLIRGISKECKSWQPEFILVGWAEGMEKLQSGEIDLMMSIAYSAHRAETMDFSGESVMEVWGQVFIRPESGIVSSLDLEGMRVGLMSLDVNGKNFSRLMRLLGVNCELVEYATHAEVFQAVQSGQVMAGVAPNHYGSRNAKRFGLQGTSIQFSPSPIYFATKKGQHAALLSDIDHWLSNWKSDPDSLYYQQLNHWFGVQVPVSQNVPVWLRFLLGGAFLAVLSLGILSWLFKYQIKLRTAELSASETRYRLLIENQSDMIVKVDPEGRFLYVSPTYCETFGKSESALLGQVFLPLVHEEDRASTEAEFKKVLRPPHKAYMEQRALTKRGWRWLSWVDTALLDKDGNVTEVIGVGRDITDRKEAQQALSSSNERLQLATKASQIGIWEYELATDTLIWDDQMFVLYGTEPEAFDGRFSDWEKRVHPDDLTAVRRIFETSIERKIPFSTDFRVVWNDGSVHYLRALAETQWDEQGDSVRVIGTNWDVSRHKHIVEALRSSEQDYRQLFENMMTGFLILKVIPGQDGRSGAYKIIQVNRAAEEMVGASRGNLVGHTLDEAFRSIEPYWGEVFDRVAETGESAAYENMMESVGRVLSLWVFVSKPGHLGVVVTDNSARRLAEDAVLKAQQQLQHVLDNTSEVIFQVDLSGNIIYSNTSIERVCGYSVSEIMGRSMFDLILPEFHGLVQERMRRRILGHPDDDAYAFQILHKNGQPVWIELLANSVLDSSGNLEAIQGVGRDITLRKQAEQALEESRWFQREVLNMLPIAVFWKDRDLNYLGCNQTYIRDLGLTDSAEIVGRDDYAVHPDSPLLDGYRERDLKVIESGLPLLNYEDVRENADGLEHVLLTSKMPFRNVNGDIVGVLGLYVDITLMKHLEEMTRQTKEQLEHIVDNTKDIIFQVDLKGDYTYVNSTVEDVAGFSPDEILQMNMMDLIAPEDRELVGSRMKKRLEGQAEVGVYAFRIVHEQGHRVWLELTTTGVVDADGGLIGVQGVARDVSERVEAQRQLEESRRFLRTIIDAIPVRVFWKDRNSVYLGGNISFAQDSGHGRPDDLIGKTDFDMGWGLHEARQYIEDDREIMHGGEGWINYEEPQTQDDGSMVWLSTSKVPIRNAENEIVGVLGAYQDITSRKSLEEERVRLSTAINQSDEAVVIMDLGGLVEYVNPAFEMITGFSREEAVGQSLTIIQSTKHDASFYEEIWQTIESEASWNGRIFARHKDGSSYTVEATISPVRYGGDEVVNYVVTIRDVSEQVELEQHVRQAQKMDAVGRLAGGVAHDFNNILQSILGFSGILLSEMEEGSSQYDDVDEIRKAARRAGELTRQLLTLSRKQNVEFTVQSVNDTIRRNEKMMRRLIGERIEFVFNLEGSLKPIRADISQIEQILLNLFINARDAMPEGGVLTVTTGNVAAEEADGADEGVPGDAGFVRISVKDSGCGIRDDVLEHLFEPFFTTKRVGEGTGLGLSVVYGIVKQHAGWIDVHSQVGEGAEFNVYLPAYNRNEGSTKARPPVVEMKVSPEGQGETILVVEDDDVLRELGARLLKNAGYEVFAAESMDAALVILMERKEELDLLFSDIVLPDGNGVDFALKARQVVSSIPVLLSSGYAQEAELFDRLKGNGFHFVEKPIASMQLLQTVREMLEEVRSI